MTKKDRALIAEGLNQICAYLGAIACLFREPEDGKSRDRPKAPETEQKEEAKPTDAPTPPADGLICAADVPDPEPAGTTHKPEAPTNSSESAAPAPPEKEVKYEDVRVVLAEKARTGYRAEVKALLTKHGISQLSDASPSIYTELLSEAEEIGNG